MTPEGFGTGRGQAGWGLETPFYRIGHGGVLPPAPEGRTPRFSTQDEPACRVATWPEVNHCSGRITSGFGKVIDPRRKPQFSTF